MSLREALLEERQKILAELESVETMLRIRCGWTPPPHEGCVPVRSRKSNNLTTSSKDERLTPAIHYSNEFREWLKNRAEPFTIGDFREHLESKFGADAVNESSARSPLNLAVEQGEVLIQEKGAGRRPTVFQSAEPPDFV